MWPNGCPSTEGCADVWLEVNKTGTAVELDGRKHPTSAIILWWRPMIGLSVSDGGVSIVFGFFDFKVSFSGCTGPIL